MKKRFLALALALVLALGGAGSALALTPADQAVEAANLKLLAAESYAMDMELTLEMELAGEAFLMEMRYDADVLMNPERMKMDIEMTVSAAGEQETIRMPMYAYEEDGMLCTATKIDGEWQHIDMPMAELTEGDLVGLDTMGAFTGVSGYWKSANAKINGRPAGRYTAKLQWEELSELMASMDLSSMMGLAGEDAAELDAAMAEAFGTSLGTMFEVLFKGVDPTEVHLYIDDETGYPVRYEAALGETMEQVMENMLDLLFEEMGLSGAELNEVRKELDLSIPRYDLLMRIQDVGEVREFSIPNAARH